MDKCTKGEIIKDPATGEVFVVTWCGCRACGYLLKGWVPKWRH